VVGGFPLHGQNQLQWVEKGAPPAPALCVCVEERGGAIVTLELQLFN
jgi:hypothetical protein